MTPEGHWYYETKYDLIFEKLTISPPPVNLIEIGAGSKFFIRKALDQYPKTTGWAVDPFYGENQLEKQDNLISTLEIPAQSGDLYLFLDVLEHVEDDLQLLKESISNASKNATVVISVPAFNHLWSGHDTFLGHHRRYTRKDLINLLNQANLEIVRCNYIFSLIYPAVYMLRKLRANQEKSDMRELNPLMNYFIKKVLKLCKKINSNRWFGLTVVAIAKIK